MNTKLLLVAATLLTSSAVSAERFSAPVTPEPLPPGEVMSYCIGSPPPVQCAALVYDYASSPALSVQIAAATNDISDAADKTRLREGLGFAAAALGARAAEVRARYLIPLNESGIRSRTRASHAVFSDYRTYQAVVDGAATLPAGSSRKALYTSALRVIAEAAGSAESYERARNVIVAGLRGAGND